MIEQRKQAVSIRLGESDLRNVKLVAKRLGVRDSDIIRYAIKSMLSRISPLCDEGITGRNLVPVLVESGDELIRYFELDAHRLETIINRQAKDELRVDHGDIVLLAMNGLREHYLMMRMKDDQGTAGESSGPARSLRTYLYDKYLYSTAESKHNEAKTAAESDTRADHQRPAA